MKEKFDDLTEEELEAKIEVTRMQIMDLPINEKLKSLMLNLFDNSIKDKDEEKEKSK